MDNAKSVPIPERHHLFFESFDIRFVPIHGWSRRCNFIVRPPTLHLRSSKLVLKHRWNLIIWLLGLLFFTNYTIWVLFWAEIYYQAGSKETRKFRPYFWIVNLAIYMFQGYLWLFTIPDSSRNTVRYISAIWLATVFLAGTIGFIFYGRTLFLMLQKYPPSFPGRNRKLHDIVGIATVCAFAFTARYSSTMTE